MLIKTSGLALLSVALATAGQLTLKKGMDLVGYLGTDRLLRPFQVFGHLLRTPAVWIGFSLFVISAGVWIIVVSRVPLSFAYPFAGLTYVLITLFSKFILHERVPSVRWAGIALIVTGIVLVATTAPSDLPERGAGLEVGEAQPLSDRAR